MAEVSVQQSTFTQSTQQNDSCNLIQVKSKTYRKITTCVLFLKVQLRQGSLGVLFHSFCLLFFGFNFPFDFRTLTAHCYTTARSVMLIVVLPRTFVLFSKFNVRWDTMQMVVREVWYRYISIRASHKIDANIWIIATSKWQYIWRLYAHIACYFYG